MCGRVIEYNQAIRAGRKPRENYADVESASQGLIAAILGAEDRHSWHMCDAIAMGLTSLHGLHLCQLRYGKQEEGDIRPLLAFQSSRKMVWDMCQFTVGMVDGQNAADFTLGGLFCVFLAGVLVMQTLQPNEFPEEEIQSFSAIGPVISASFSSGGVENVTPSPKPS